MYYKNKNISFSQKLLNPVIKYKKCNKKGDCFTTNSGLKTDQKIYTGKSKKTLITYIKKEGNNFYSKKKLKENEGIKHLIISPIDPQVYNKLNEKEKEKLQQIIIKNIFKDLGRFGFIGGLEHKKRIIEGKEYEHFHIHLGISEKYDISPQNIDYLKRSITRAILKSDLKNKLGLKTSAELKKETWHKKTAELYQEKAQEYLKIKNLFNEIKEISGQKNILKNENAKDYENIKYLGENKRIELQAINKQKDFLIMDIKETAGILKERNNELKNINMSFEILKNEMKNANNIAFYKLNAELQDYRDYLNNDLFYFTQILKFEHNIYIRYLKNQMKNKKIDLPKFLYLISVNKYYINNRKKAKKEEIKFKIKQKREEIQRELSNIHHRYIEKFQKLKYKKEYIEFINNYDANKLKNLNIKLKEIKKEKNNLNAYYKMRIKMILDYINERQNKYNELNQKQQRKLDEIQTHKSTIKNKKYNKEKLKNDYQMENKNKIIQQPKPRPRPRPKPQQKQNYNNYDYDYDFGL